MAQIAEALPSVAGLFADISSAPGSNLLSKLGSVVKNPTTLKSVTGDVSGLIKAFTPQASPQPIQPPVIEPPVGSSGMFPGPLLKPSGIDFNSLKQSQSSIKSKPLDIQRLLQLLLASGGQL